MFPALYRSAIQIALYFFKRYRPLSPRAGVPLSLVRFTRPVVILCLALRLGGEFVKVDSGQKYKLLFTDPECLQSHYQQF